MTITKADVADLRPGDVVEFRIDDWPESQAIRTTLRVNEHGALTAPIPGDGCTSYWVRDAHGHAFDGEHRTLTVVSRAPRPLYVNHDRTEPVDGDIVRDRDGDAWRRAIGRWFMAGGDRLGVVQDLEDYKPLRLLWDGENGEVVP